MTSLAFNRDCMEAMREFPDKFFDLAVVDPPYGGGCSQSVHVERESGGPRYNRFGGQGSVFEKYKRFSDRREVGGEVRKKIVAWDVAPGKEYFDELFRVSRNQIIWGGNYFSLPPTRCFLVWQKTNVPQDFTMAMAEYAWTSFIGNAKVFPFSAIGQIGRFHPTQKPPELYAWILKNYAKPGDKILDTHLGSGSSRIAAYDAGLDFWGYEIDKVYFELQEKRFAKHAAQISLFIDEIE